MASRFNPRHAAVLFASWAMLAAPGCGGQSADDPGTAQEEPKDEADAQAPLVFGVYALSRGAGVPEETREAMQAVADFVAEDEKKGVAVRTERTRLGLEGETRLCIEYEDQDAATAAFQRIQALVEGVDLMNLVDEACMKEPVSEEPESG